MSMTATQWTEFENLYPRPPFKSGAQPEDNLVPVVIDLNERVELLAASPSTTPQFVAAFASATFITGEFPLIDTAGAERFDYAWYNCSGLTAFPVLDVSAGTTFNNAWYGCGSLVTFPSSMFDSCLATDFSSAFTDCSLDQTSVDNILVSLDTAGQSGGTVDITGGANAGPGAAGIAAKANLEANGWTVNVN